ncbi:helix-turn-helix domain-containing protein [Agrobacterium larrymoorei]|uniref:Helix-turn-helix transcriptional regulator n=1 Tax=Agrobacterium larrymoorei TaxID=160699 RepID=A0A4D7E3Q0_9HYPH|nr:helix-turn-helix domain-containing protein [Agrobacterium larrymoorei]QCJ00767.1 helix-turn-helix transcriptional regulator [Agrobacterium larrymoorei]QYA10770.1 helix-turn-helix transcriptional regulator [Agrobacterium larrymoorei]
MFKTAQDLGQAIKQRRKNLGWTQAELARRSGTGDRFVIELEAGKPSCQLEKALIVARTVGLELIDRKSLSPQARAEDDDLHFLPKFGDSA